MHLLLKRIQTLGIAIMFVTLGLCAYIISTNCIELSKPAENSNIDGVLICGNNVHGGSQKGAQLFVVNCQRCHIIGKKSTGPNLAGVQSRWADSTNLHAWIKNSQRYLKAAEDPYAIALFKEYGGVVMPAFPQLTDEDVREILNYIP